MCSAGGENVRVCGEGEVSVSGCRARKGEM